MTGIVMNAYSFVPVEELIQPLPLSPHLFRANRQDVKLPSFRESKSLPKKKPGSPTTQLPSIRPSPHRFDEPTLPKVPTEKHLVPVVKSKPTKKPGEIRDITKRRKLYVSMDEVLATSLKKKTTNAAIRTLTQEEEQDPKKILLYDEQPFNRKRAAKRLCEMITIEVRGGSSQHVPDKVDKNAESSESESETEETEVEFPNMKVNDFKKHFHEETTLSEKLDVVKKLAQEYVDIQRMKMMKTVSFRDLQDESEQTPAAAESQLLSTNKSVDKSRHAGGDWGEVIESELPGNPMRMSRLMYLGKEVTSKVPGLRNLLQTLETATISEFKSKLESKKSLETSEDGPSKEIFSFRRLIIPDFNLKPLQALNIYTYLSKLSELRVVDMSHNPHIGDTAGATLVYLLCQTAPLLSKLALEQCGLGLNSAFAVKELLGNHNTKLRTLLVGSNGFGEAGLCHISMSLIFNQYVQVVDVSANQGDVAAAVAFSKMIRMNRCCKVLSLSGNTLPLAVFREICRSLIVNTTLQYLSLKNSGLSDNSMKELAHCLNSNRGLHAVMLNNNNLTSKGLTVLRSALPSHPTLSHLGITGNLDITISDLEDMRTLLVKKLDVEVIKEEDFAKTAEYASLGLDKLLKV